MNDQSRPFRYVLHRFPNSCREYSHTVILDPGVTKSTPESVEKSIGYKQNPCEVAGFNPLNPRNPRLIPSQPFRLRGHRRDWTESSASHTERPPIPKDHSGRAEISFPKNFR